MKELVQYITELNLYKKKRQVYINTTHKEIGKEIANAISTTDITGGWPVKKIRQGFGFKDFTVIMVNQDGAEALYNNIKNINNTPEPEPEPEQDPESPVPETTNQSSTLLLIAGAIVLISIGIVIWRR